MKQFIYIICYILILNNVFAYDFYCVVEDGATILDNPNTRYTSETSKFNNSKILVSTDNREDNYLLVKKVNKPIYIDYKDLKIPNHKYVDSLLKNKNWLLLECADALFKNDLSLTYKYTGNIKKYVTENPDKLDFPEDPWEWYMGPVIFTKYDSICGIIRVDCEVLPAIHVSFFISNFDEKNVQIYVTSKNINFESNVFFNIIEEDQLYNLTYKIDGDYLEIFYNDEKILTFVNADETLINAYTDFIREEDYSLDNIIWPHHADGTSEYEDTIRYPEPIVIEEPEEIEIEEYKEPEKKEIPPFPDEKDPNYLEIIKEYYPNIYEDQLKHFEYLNTMKKIKILVISITSVIIMLLLFIIIKNKRKSNKL